MLGLPNGRVILAPWSEQWHEGFLQEKEKIEEVGRPYIAEVHHIGSTSVKYLRAKPVLDIAVELAEFKDGVYVSSLLEQLGYDYKGTEILPDRHYLSKGSPRTHQIHMFERGNSYLMEQLKFRNCLRNNEKVRKEYELLKIKLAEAYASDKFKYTREKASFIQSILRNYG
ncbi:GrpB family protein [Salimicrobium halophilum]|uniref:GrpB domain, predicted nucleotidyltransferase, UPF0157 family n=1 Tax=Salimicrobium halophilum TaxID=86666 RepID=A0A1G8QYI0_9BACI|nr:GrpB family protein [Salimicrobium halophilum]SDJ09683.1 GrpB domain, predicted nucleotidyltransferase, UPF0157 family [Salimicrobium halophilum]